MKLGVYYNFFDCEELIKKSILSVREVVDTICVVFQEVSNYGSPCSLEARYLLDDLQKEGLIDAIHVYVFDENNTPAWNECRKRNIGLWMCQVRACDHALGMDADEFYDEGQIKNAKDVIEEKNIDVSVCRLNTFFKKPIYQVDPPENFFVPFIHKLDRVTKLKLEGKFPVLVDPTRRLRNVKQVYSFARENLEMFHYSFVRKDIRVKLENSTAKVNFIDIDAYVKMFESWEPGNLDFHPSNPSEFHDVIEVENRFGIEL